MSNDCISPNVAKLVGYLPEGGLLLLENVRYYKEEKKNDEAFARKLVSLADLFVNDAFAIADKAHASTCGVATYLKPSVAGFLMQKELHYLDKAMNNPKRPFVAFIGGSRVSTKSDVINSLLYVIDYLFLGGEMIFTFYAQGREVGLSLVETDKLDLATSLMEKVTDKNVPIVLPSVVISPAAANMRVFDSSHIQNDWIGLDIGPDSIKSYVQALDIAKTVIWNVPVGMFGSFTAGTKAIIEKLADIQDEGVITIIVGNDSIDTVEEFGLRDKLSQSHFSTGGDVSLKLLARTPLPGVVALDDKL